MEGKRGGGSGKGMGRKGGPWGRGEGLNVLNREVLKKWYT